ncbi:hypothetical protein L1987_85795 [Smallanthus sonchifolius]|uniref:Uncharacterized protein n=1 Tax=Smallanthus sonchifolius TaxID=185202 RepID=A0ACB8XWV5_9ASTR|nr:hypothetical protein L1987_85795 [Smallanthus sonchifolius]
MELAPNYLPLVYNNIKNVGGLVIADEVQSGFARTGTNFWGFQNQGIVPDIVTMAKGIGNGIQLGAVVTIPEIAKVLTRRSYFNTFGGNPVCSTAGHVVLKVIERENLQENAHIVGSYLKERLTALKDKHERFILEVELVTDRKLKTPSKTEIVETMEMMKGNFESIIYEVGTERDISERLTCKSASFISTTDLPPSSFLRGSMAKTSEVKPTLFHDGNLQFHSQNLTPRPDDDLKKKKAEYRLESTGDHHCDETITKTLERTREKSDQMHKKQE